MPVLPLPKTRHIPLTAGPLRLSFDSADGSLRSLMLGDELAVHSIMIAVRDHNWGTIVPAITIEKLDHQVGSFHIDLVADCRHDAFDYQWRGVISGDATGIHYQFNGIANSDVRSNRIGFCVLHPQSCGGKACRIEHVDGQKSEGIFPLLISPNQPFLNVRQIAHEVIPGSWASVRMEGDTFEMEDQRNWTDASFKTYCRPLSLPFPVAYAKGSTIQQSVHVAIQRSSTPSVSTVTTEHTHSVTIPSLGVVTHASADVPTSIADPLLKALGLKHLRVDLHAADWHQRIDAAHIMAHKCAAALELAIHMDAATDAMMLGIMNWCEANTTPIARVLILLDGVAPAKRSERLRSARAIFPDFIPVLAGTDHFFAELNRSIPEAGIVDGYCWSINPQVHFTDDASVMETLQAQSQTVRSALAWAPEALAAVGPVTFKMRRNPNATSGDGIMSRDAQRDPRQHSAFGAAWTLGSIASLALGGAHSSTFFEDLGALGIIPLADDRDPLVALDAQVHPIYHVLADLAGCAGRNATVSRVGRSTCQIQLRGTQPRLLVANLGAEADMIPLPPAQQFRILDATTLSTACCQPQRWREDKIIAKASLCLPGYSYARIDLE